MVCLYNYFVSPPVCYLSSYIFQFLFHLIPAYLSIVYSGLYGRRSFLCDVPKVIGHFFERPASLSCSMSEVMSQVMEGEIVNEFPLILGAICLQRPEPVMNPFLGQALAPLRGKEVDFDQHLHSH